MEEIALMQDPDGRWVMMCLCGASEIRAGAGPTWHDLERPLLEEFETHENTDLTRLEHGEVLII